MFDVVGFLPESMGDTVIVPSEIAEMLKKLPALTCSQIQSLPDLIPYNGPGGTAYQCQISAVSFTLSNLGGVNSSACNSTILVRWNGAVIDTITQAIPSILSALAYPNNFYSFSLPFIPASTGTYSFELRCDIPSNTVTELNENNNIARNEARLNAL